MASQLISEESYSSNRKTIPREVYNCEFRRGFCCVANNNMDSKREDCPWPAVQEKVSDSGVSLYYCVIGTCSRTNQCKYALLRVFYETHNYTTPVETTRWQSC